MINKSKGLTRTEELLGSLCDNTFLKAWSFPNPINSDKKELCDLLVVFDNHMFIFFDREIVIQQDFLEKPDIYWKRWNREVINKQTITCHGAERYIRNKNKVYLDTELKTLFPIPYDPTNVVIHKIVVAHGAKDACLLISDQNINGSLAVTYTSSEENENIFPFQIYLDRNNPVHVLDSHNLSIILKELDTFHDFISYITEKEKAIRKYESLSYCGEEDLLAHYYLNYDEANKKHFIGSLDEAINGILIGEGEWNGFINTPAYKSKKEADSNSYLWDDLIQKTCDNALNDKLGGNSNLFAGASAIYEMAREPRLARRSLSENMIAAINNFPESATKIIRHMVFMPSYFSNKAYIFLQFKANVNNYDEYRRVRQYLLEVACGAAKNKFQYLETIIGIALEPPKVSESVSEDFILMDCKNWPIDKADYYRKENEQEATSFFLKNNLSCGFKETKEFPNEGLK